MEYPRVSDEDREKLVVRLRDSANFMLKAADAEGWSAADLTRGISHLALQAATEIEDARALLRDAAEALRKTAIWVDGRRCWCDEASGHTEDCLFAKAVLARIEGGASS